MSDAEAPVGPMGTTLESRPAAPASESRIGDEQAELIDALGRLPRRSPIRLAAVQLLFERGAPSLSPFLSGLRLPGARHWRDRLVSAWGLAGIAVTEEDRAAATLSLADALQARRGEGWAALVGAGLWRAFIGAAGLAVLYQAVGPWAMHYLLMRWQDIGVYHDVRDLARAAEPFLAAAVVLLVPGSAGRDNAANMRARQAIAGALGRLGSLDGIGPLADVYARSSGTVREACRDALLDVLRNVDAEHYGVLGPTSIAALCRTLRSDDAVLVAQVLRAIELIGTRSAIPELERLVSGSGPMRLRDQAAAVLDVVRAREESQLHRERLLRPAGSPTEHLLRPVPSAPTADPDLLLRAAAGAGADPTPPAAA